MNDATQLPYFHKRFYRRTPRSVPMARDFGRRTLERWGLTDRAEDMLLCVSELATNALLHGVPVGRGFLLHMWLLDDHVVRLEMHDSGDGRPVARTTTAAEEERGRGLLLVDALADKWGVGERDPGKVVWCEFACAPPEGAV
ncbi:ATP-binding protein [Streptomyces syringium]|uniref:ATP-binding protein n=1 Tax=Streptomyces syringium TaxID=76729 RepID=UPI00343B05C1